MSRSRMTVLRRNSLEIVRSAALGSKSLFRCREMKIHMSRQLNLSLKNISINLWWWSRVLTCLTQKGWKWKEVIQLITKSSLFVIPFLEGIRLDALRRNKRAFENRQTFTRIKLVPKRLAIYMGCKRLPSIYAWNSLIHRLSKSQGSRFSKKQRFLKWEVPR